MWKTLIAINSASAAPAPFANRSTATSTNGFALYFRSVGSGMKRISRVVLSAVYRSDVSETRASVVAHSTGFRSMTIAVVPRLKGRINSANPIPSTRCMRAVSVIWMTRPMIDE